ncbi:GTPase or GTP-binding protein-like protein [Metallosphaera sedula]|uniref:polynucleotide 5'-hydroxyl-kinase n=4 Tax=Metallosphaera TaxID=41980 RepID=A4YIC5_METS5|nr:MULTISPECIES: Clp1/GlmU family protein [Metallosphaera]ABP96177.1 GTPase or GTP-binding protein-like protein [Metallosphaera sedula DSM 5348]AIM28160.1 GTPase or GTP-binding protein-like protein [Metallosphaera sedula]AKV74980.1 GTP-binding protein [Metallosphaera sedula]AKV77218.1 GTP-binding protein [Metallosphaera sedula]AKV79468.1 GTP-binding protein [Metallosphaera sedula]
MRVYPNQYVIMRGPCELRVTGGEIRIMGLSQDLYLIPDTTFTVYSRKGAEIESDCESLATLPTTGWEEVAELISLTGGRVIVIGDLDSGKSYFSRTLYNMAKDFAYADLDLGQSSLFLPTFMSMTQGSKLWFHNPLSFTRAEFFGDISPSRDPNLHLELSLRLVKDIRNIVVDTDGWIRSSGVWHKRKLIELLDPDYVVALGVDALRLMPRNYRQRTFLLKPVQIRRKKTRTDRRANRRSLYERYFAWAKEVSVSSFGRRIGLTGSSCYLHDHLNGLMVGIISGGKIVGAGLMKMEEGPSIKTPVSSFDDFVLGFVSVDAEWTERRLF